MKKWRPALVIILSLAAILRLRGLTFGLPAVYNPDEVAIMSRTLGFATGDLNPHNFLYPTLYFYVLFVWEGLYFLGGRLLGAIPSRAAFQESFFLDPTGIYIAGRALGVVCGLLTVWAAWRFGRRIASPIAGMAAALFLAVAPFAVRDAHYVKHDVAATLFITLAVMAALCLVEDIPRARGQRLVMAAVVAGLAMSIHYYAVFVALPLMFAIWLAWADASIGKRVGQMARATALVAVTFFLTSPFLLAEPLTAWRDIRANREIVIDRAAAIGGHTFASAPDYLRMLWQDATGWPVILLALAGLIMLARRRPHVCLLLILFPSAFLIFISTTIAATRYLNPVLPFVALLAGVTIARLAEMSASSRVAAMAAAFAVLASVPGLAASWHTGTFFQQRDTRTLALDYFRTSVPSGAGVLVQPYSVPVPESRQSLVDALTEHLGDPGKASTKSRLRLLLSKWPEPSYRVIYLGHGGLDADKIYIDYPELGGAHGLSALERRQVQYVILKRYNDEPAVVGPLVEALGQKARRVAVFSPYAVSGAVAPVAPFLHNADRRIDPALERPGPVLDIWQLP
jgi:dolichyl-phosphate-mannose-protein mannosyltransferase